MTAPWPQRCGSRHRALADARAALGPVAVLVSATARGDHPSAVATIVGRPELPPQIDPALIDDLPEAAGAYAFYGKDGRLLLSRRSSNLRQQVLAHFAPDKRDTPLMLATSGIEWRDAAGELGARLREIELARSVARRRRRSQHGCAARQYGQ
jgi:DNA polymerase-3 subunit epsilon